MARLSFEVCADMYNGVNPAQENTERDVCVAPSADSAHRDSRLTD
jgi:hypothetical protein